MDSIFSQRLKTLREERGLTMQKLGEEIGTSGVSIGYYERGERVPDIHILAKMCQFFGVTSDYLIGLEDCRTHEAADISARTGLTEAAVAVLTFFSESDFPPTLFLEMIGILIEKSFDYLDGEWNDEEEEELRASPDLSAEEREKLKQEQAQEKQKIEREKAVGLQCRHGADILTALCEYYFIHTSYDDHLFRVSIHDGTVIEDDLRIEGVPLMFNGKELVEKIMLDRLIDKIKLGAKEFADEHPELRRKVSPNAGEE